MAKLITDTPPAPVGGKQPTFATQSAGMTHPHIDVTPPFLWTFHPERWVVMAGKLVPSLQKVPLVAGVNHVEVDEKGRIHLARTRAKLEEEGRTVIPYQWAPDRRSYIYAIETIPTGSKSVQEAWLSVFESAHVGASEASTDEDAYVEWLGALLDNGLVTKCHVATASRMLEVARSRLAKARADAAKLGGHGAASIRADAISQEVEVLEAYVTSARPARVSGTGRRTPDFGEGGAAAGAEGEIKGGAAS